MRFVVFFTPEFITFLVLFAWACITEVALAFKKHEEFWVALAEGLLVIVFVISLFFLISSPMIVIEVVE